GDRPAAPDRRGRPEPGDGGDGPVGGRRPAPRGGGGVVVGPRRRGRRPPHRPRRRPPAVSTALVVRAVAAGHARAPCAGTPVGAPRQKGALTAASCPQGVWPWSRFAWSGTSVCGCRPAARAPVHAPRSKGAPT